MTRDLHLRRSAAEYLIFSAQSEADAIEVRYEDGTLWLTQKMLGLLFGVENPRLPTTLQTSTKTVNSLKRQLSPLVTG